MDSYGMIDSLGETCVICEKSKIKGIHLYTSFICCECEKEIINTEADDDKYKHFLYQLRKVTHPISKVN
ncbi:sigma factor G inhibitor Gin [Calidifontibacillus oryziterrae]|uniref:sigma factor G inhibitor Gin n=1 Tax=Calidifontibacillus oryziterrae TaxID=1191699 RepID=UPI0002FEE904|nr:sigma factor G inhibitor Gin [Calidifontibacillus oryziterrae]